MDCILVEIVVKPKNTIIKKSGLNNILFNIETGKSKWGSGYYRDKICDWVDELDEKHYMLKSDTMYIKYIHSLSNSKDGRCDAIEMINEDLELAQPLSYDYNKIWELAKPDFSDFLQKREYTRMKFNYLMTIDITSSYGYEGDGDVYYHFNNLIKYDGGFKSLRSEEELKKLEKVGYGWKI